MDKVSASSPGLGVSCRGVEHWPLFCGWSLASEGAPGTSLKSPPGRCVSSPWWCEKLTQVLGFPSRVPGSSRDSEAARSLSCCIVGCGALGQVADYVERAELEPPWELSSLVTLAAWWWLCLGEGGSRISLQGLVTVYPEPGCLQAPPSALPGCPPDPFQGLRQPVLSTSGGWGSSLNSSCIGGVDPRAVRGGPHRAPVSSVAGGCGCSARGSLDDRACPC